ncbi:MAG: hesB/YadR/YfhF [Candidatus Xenolissoclinum pacificiensis L6]|uniref:HesB/YadR/YfhF n=1 Tax=Candidatus Xenolissoclinum pacificiensis L6 TaxID=1401685 RepID=W2V325_9RICK|nr:MAG: hesB/YadR/YfhF [Candidatus Xenolissoclinum pacificiensis L6]
MNGITRLKYFGITDSAVQRILLLKGTHVGENLLLRFEILSGGCKEYQYNFTTETGEKYKNIVSNPEILQYKFGDVFSQKLEEEMRKYNDASQDLFQSPPKNHDVLLVNDDDNLAITNISTLRLLANGSSLDYISDMTHSMFTINNPDSKISCGCGISFTL